jgi:hypothetical protein
MKKLLKQISFYMFTLLACVALASCGDDDDEIDASEDDLIGTWVVYEDDGWEIYEGEKDTWSHKYGDSDFYAEFTFKSDGSFIERVTEDYESETNYGTWVLKGSTLILFEDGDLDDSIVLRIKTFTPTVLTVEAGDGKEDFERVTLHKM